MSEKHIRLIASIVAAVAGVVSVAQPGGEHMAITPNPKIQTFLRLFSSTNLQDRETLFSADERRMFVEAETEAEGADLLQRKFEELRTDAGGTEALIAQLLYFKLQATDVPEAMLPAVIIGRLNIPMADLADSVLPFTDAENKRLKSEAWDWLGATDKAKNGGYDFSRYERILRGKPLDESKGLVLYMFNRNPDAAVLSMSRIYGDKVAENEVVDILNGDPKTVLHTLLNRPEWWARLYVAEMMKQQPRLRDTVILRKLEKDENLLVKERVAEIKLGK